MSEGDARSGEVKYTEYRTNMEQDIDYESCWERKSKQRASRASDYGDGAEERNSSFQASVEHESDGNDCKGRSVAFRASSDLPSPCANSHPILDSLLCFPLGHHPSTSLQAPPPPTSGAPDNPIQRLRQHSTPPPLPNKLLRRPRHLPPR